MINSGVILASLFLISIFGNIFSYYQIKHKKEELTTTKESLYVCLERNKENEKKLSEIDKQNIYFNKKYNIIQKKYSEDMVEANHKISNILALKIQKDCEAAIGWGASHSAEIARDY